MRRGRLTLSGWMGLVAATISLAAPVTAAVAQRTKYASPSSQNVSRLIKQLKSPELQRRREAARELGAIKPLPPEAIQALAEALHGRTNTAVARYAIKALGEAGPRAVPALTALTKNRNPQACQSAVLALGQIAKHDPAVWLILVSVFKSDFNRAGAADELAKVGPPVIPLLRKAIRSSEPRIRAGAAETIGLMGKYASHSDWYARSEVVFASTADLATAIPELIAALKDPDANVRNQAAVALAYADPDDTRSVPILAKLLSSRDFILHDAAIAALENMGSAAKGAVPALEHALASNPDPVLRAGAASLLDKLGGAQACGSLARAAMGDQNLGVKGAAATAMTAL